MKLTEQDKVDIRKSYQQAKHPQNQIRVLSELYLISRAEVKRIVGINPVATTKSQDRKAEKLRLMQEVYKLCEAGYSYSRAAQMTGITRATASKWHKALKEK